MSGFGHPFFKFSLSLLTLFQKWKQMAQVLQPTNWKHFPLRKYFHANGSNFNTHTTTCSEISIHYTSFGRMANISTFTFDRCFNVNKLISIECLYIALSPISFGCMMFFFEILIHFYGCNFSCENHGKAQVKGTLIWRPSSSQCTLSQLIERHFHVIYL